MMHFIGSFEYRVTFLVKIRRFNGQRKWTLHCWAVVLGQIFRQIVSIRVMTLINTNVVASRHIKREVVLLPVAVRHSKTPELKLNFIRGNENVTHSAQGEMAFLGRIFCLEYPCRRSERVNVYFANYRFSFRKLQIFISQITDFHFANYRFSFRTNYDFVSFHFVSFHFVSQTTVSRFNLATAMATKHFITEGSMSCHSHEEVAMLDAEIPGNESLPGSLW